MARGIAAIENGITRNLSTFVRAYRGYRRLAIVCRLEFYGRRPATANGTVFRMTYIYREKPTIPVRCIVRNSYFFDDNGLRNGRLTNRA